MRARKIGGLLAILTVCTYLIIATTDACAQASPAPAKPTAQNASTIGSTQLTDEQIAEIKREVEGLREQHFQQLSAEANSSIQTANTVIQFSTYLFAFVTFLVFALGFFGLSEYRKIRSRYNELDRSIRKQYEEIEGLKGQLKGEIGATEDQIRSIQERSIQAEKDLQALKSRIEQESQTTIEASHNFHIAIVAYINGRYEEAIEFFKTVATIQPRNTRCLCRIGRAYLYLGDVPHALEYFDKGLQIDPNNTEALRGIASTYRYEYPKKALEYAKLATEAGGLDCQSLDYLGLIFRDNGLFDEAIQAHRQALEIKSRAETQFFLSLLYQHKQDHDRAKRWIQSAYVDSKEEEILDRIRKADLQLLPKLIRCTQLLIVENNKDAALLVAKDISSNVYSERQVKSVLNHLRFLLQTFGEPDLTSAFDRVFSDREKNK